MSLFIADLAFEDNEILLEQAKAAILAASLIAGIWGALFLYLTNPAPLPGQRASQTETDIHTHVDEVDR